MIYFCQKLKIMGSSRIITFANQKGGVGKTTLALCFALYLTKHAYKYYVRYCDCDPQFSAFNKRTKELEKYDGIPPYELTPININDAGTFTTFCNSLKSVDDTINIIDLPGYIKNPNIIPAITLSDYIMIPFQWENLSVASTVSFLSLIDKIKETYKERFKAKVFLIPNFYVSNVGTAEEKKRWERYTQMFCEQGYLVVPPVPNRKNLQRFSTLTYFDNLEEELKPTFNTIIHYIKNYNQ